MFFPVRRSGFRSWRKMSTFVAKKLSVMLKTLLFIGAGSFVGGVARYLLSRAVQSGVSSPFPWGTMAVNVAGCLLIGILYGLFERNHIGSDALRMFLTVGFCGGFTTFSTFVHENYALLGAGHFSHMPYSIPLRASPSGCWPRGSAT